jgi:uncharacterized protein DUF1330
MPTYIVGDIQINDPAADQAHLARALATIARFGGRVVAGGGKSIFSKGIRCLNGSLSSNFRQRMRPEAGTSPMTIRRR